MEGRREGVEKGRGSNRRSIRWRRRMTIPEGNSLAVASPARDGGRDAVTQDRGSRRTEAHCHGVCVNVPLNLRAESVERVRIAITIRLGQCARLSGMNRMVELAPENFNSASLP